MAKTEKKLQDMKDKVEELNKELKELSDEELDQVAGGLSTPGNCPMRCSRFKLTNLCYCD